MSIAARIDSTLLRPDTTAADLKKLCEEAAKHKMAGVCVPPFWVRETKRLVGDGFGAPRVVTVAGFPMGYSGIAAKSEEIKRAVEDGADEIDAVANVCAIKAGAWNHVQHDIESMARACHLRGRQIKIIFETALLTHAEIQQLCNICIGASVNFAKTSTGFAGQGATVDAVRFLRAHLPDTIKIKASGGISTRAFAEELIAAGADRIGSSNALGLL